MKLLKVFILSAIPFYMHAQKVEIKVMDNFADLASEQTQSELKPGWTVFDIKLKDKLIHYLSGGHSSQLTDDNMPNSTLFHQTMRFWQTMQLYVFKIKNFIGKSPKA